MKLLRTVITASALMLPALAAAQDVKIDFDKAYDFSTREDLCDRDRHDVGQRPLAAPRARRDSTRRSPPRAGRRSTRPGRTSSWSCTAPPRPSATPTPSTAAWAATATATAVRRHGLARTTVVSEYAVGTLVVDMFDAKNKNLVFRGTAEDEISDNPEKNAKRLEKASTKMFKNFPPAKTSSARHDPPPSLRPAAGGPFLPSRSGRHRLRRSPPAAIGAAPNGDRRFAPDPGRLRVAGSLPIS